MAPIGFSLSSTEIVTPLATLLAAFFGAWFAYKLQNKTREEEQLNLQIEALNKALFTLFQQLNNLALIKTDFIDPIRHSEARFIIMRPMLTENPQDFMHDFQSLAFLLNTKHNKSVFDLFIAQQKYINALRVLNYRSDLHYKQLQPSLIRANMIPGAANYPLQDYYNALGEPLSTELKNATDLVIYHVDSSLLLLIETKNTFIKALNDLFPDQKFSDFELTHQ